LFLTPREDEVLRALALGASTARIGELLGISPSTVRSYVKSILAKFGVHSRIEAVALLLGGSARVDMPAWGPRPPGDGRRGEVAKTD